MNDRVANFGEQVGTLLPRLRRFARALTRHPQDADDLVQLAVEREGAREPPQVRAVAPGLELVELDAGHRA